MIQLRPGLPKESTGELVQLVETLEDVERRLERIVVFCERIAPLVERAEKFAKRFGY